MTKSRPDSTMSQEIQVPIDTNVSYMEGWTNMNNATSFTRIRSSTYHEKLEYFGIKYMYSLLHGQYWWRDM